MQDREEAAVLSMAHSITSVLRGCDEALGDALLISHSETLQTSIQELTQLCLKEHQTGIGRIVNKEDLECSLMFTILIFLKAITVAWVCAESQTFKFFGFFKQRNILNKSYFNTEVVENCLIAKEKNHI